MSSNVQSALDEAGKVVKKQKVCSTKIDECLNQLITLVRAAKERVEAGNAVQSPKELQKKLEQLGLTKEMNNQTKDLHSAVNKLSKASVLRHGVPASNNIGMRASSTACLPCVTVLYACKAQLTVGCGVSARSRRWHCCVPTTHAVCKVDRCPS